MQGCNAKAFFTCEGMSESFCDCSKTFFGSRVGVLPTTGLFYPDPVLRITMATSSFKSPNSIGREPKLRSNE